VPLDDTGSRKFLAGISDPRQALGLSPVWPGIAIALASLEADVIADCGRFDAGATQPLSVLAEAHGVLMVMRPTLRQVSAARPRIDMVAQVLGGRDKLGLLLIGEAGLRPVDISRTLDLRVVASLPDDASTAKVLSDGDGRRTRLDRTSLMRAAKTAGRAVTQFGRPPLVPDFPEDVPGLGPAEFSTVGPDPSGRGAAWTDERGSAATERGGKAAPEGAPTIGGFRGVSPRASTASRADTAPRADAGGYE
jgi:hypothetical protein